MRTANLTRRLAMLLACVLPVAATPAAEPDPANDAALAKLKHADMEVRIEGLRALMTSLDPRVPDALLPLLRDEGNSTRRLAARSVGSRWWQIPEARVPAFVEALKKNAASEHEGEANMAKRSIGLLERTYAGDQFARSANKRWVIYERRGLPCLIDTGNETEELLGFDPEDNDWLASTWGNTALDEAVFWHPEKEVAAMSVLLHRKASVVWIWKHEEGLHKITVAEFAEAMGMKEDDIFGAGGFFAEATGWKGDDCGIELFFTTRDGDDFTDHEATFAWDAEKAALRPVSRKKIEF